MYLRNIRKVVAIEDMGLGRGSDCVIPNCTHTQRRTNAHDVHRGRTHIHHDTAIHRDNPSPKRRALSPHPAQSRHQKRKQTASHLRHHHPSSIIIVLLSIHHTLISAPMHFPVAHHFLFCEPLHELPPMTTSPPRTALLESSALIECGTTPAVIGNSTGAVLTMRTTLPEPGVSRKQKKGRSQPSSV